MKQKEEADAKAAQKKADAEAKKQAKLDAMTPEQKQALEDKKEAAAKKQAERDAAALIELNEIRAKIDRPAIAE